MFPNHAVKSRSRHTRNHEWHPVHQEGLPHHRRLRQMCLPEIETQHRDCIGSRSGFVAVQKQAPHRGPYTEGGEIISAHQLRRHRLCVVIPGHTHCERRLGNQPAEHRVLLPQIAVHGIGKFMSMTGAAPAFGMQVSRNRSYEAQHHQLCGIAHRQRPHQRLVDEAEDRRVGADRERQG